MTLARIDVSSAWGAFMDNIDNVLPPFGRNYERPFNDLPGALTAGEAADD